MGSLHLNSYGLAPLQAPTNKSLKPSRHTLSFSPSRLKIRAVSTVPESSSEAKEPEEPPVSILHLFILCCSRWNPRCAFSQCSWGQKLRDIMMDTNIELYGPYSRALLNCGGGGTCATCMVEVIEGKELLSPRTDNEKEKLKKKPKNWRLACQTTVGNPDSRGLVVIQQLPEWKAHEWNYEKLLFSEMLSEIQSD
ncbi:photosynthetic NDH subunit of subcomplex B 3 [Populus alba x Populus x berolinensis]|nr:photosynthetic NDH subunit of subcomplex B 3 [Populus alba x Populus x berolinensis]